MGFRARLQQDGTFIFWDADFDPGGREWDARDVSLGSCSECGGDVEIVEVDHCPHIWKSRAVSRLGMPSRRCILCHKEETGRAVFD